MRSQVIRLATNGKGAHRSRPRIVKPHHATHQTHQTPCNEGIASLVDFWQGWAVNDLLDHLGAIQIPVRCSRPAVGCIGEQIDQSSMSRCPANGRRVVGHDNAQSEDADVSTEPPFVAHLLKCPWLLRSFHRSPQSAEFVHRFALRTEPSRPSLSQALPQSRQSKPTPLPLPAPIFSFCMN